MAVRLSNPNNQLFAPNKFRCDSDDEKPIQGVRNGDELLEVDTSKFYLFDKEHEVWILQDFEPAEETAYVGTAVVGTNTVD